MEHIPCVGGCHVQWYALPRKVGPESDPTRRERTTFTTPSTTPCEKLCKGEKVGEGTGMCSFVPTAHLLCQIHGCKLATRCGP